LIRLKHTYILLILMSTVLGCKQTKYVPDGRYLLKKNKIEQKGEKLDKYEVEDIIRLKPNYRSFGVKWQLMAFTLIDSTKVADKRIRKNEQIREKNRNRLARQDRINSKRMDRAIAKDKAYYTQKIVSLKDTVEPQKFFREWYKYKIGRPPVVFDSLPYSKTIEQLNAYLRTKGYYHGEVTGEVKYKNKQKQKCIVTYTINSGQPYRINEVYMVSDNPLLYNRYTEFVDKHYRDTNERGLALRYYEGHPLQGEKFDRDVLDDYRYRVAKHMRNVALYGFSSNHITILADTNEADLTVNIGLNFGDRYIKPISTDTLIRTQHVETYINNVYFHIADTIHYKGSFVKKIREMGYDTPYDGQFLRTIDTTYFTKVRDKETNYIDASRVAIFMHNGELVIRPKTLEAQNYLEQDGMYSEKNLEKSYLSLLQLNLFDAVKTEIHEISSPGCVDVHYYLVPSKKQSFGFEPRATTSNGFLGVAATINYVNRNLFRGAEKLTMSLSGGFESQPPIFDETIDGQPIQTAARSFNTFEIGPSTSLDLPGLFPIRLRSFSKKLRPKTIISAAYNFQQRDDFIRGTFQLNYLWRFFSKKTMIFQSGLPGMSVIKFVNIHKSDAFGAKLTQLNDLFLLNAYSNQFIWQDWKFTFEYNIKERENRKGDAQLYFKTTFDPAGNIFSLFKKYQDTLIGGQHSIAGVGYSQFARLDNSLIVSKPVNNEQSLNFRFEMGAGIPYGNTETSMPYDYSFFGGGANDNRGWRARSLGPGSYQYYLDSNRTATQIGDMRLGASAEYRFEFNRVFKGALFVDAGNVWTTYEDKNRVGGQISKNWYKEIAVAAGFGVRVDLEYFIVRVDLGIPLYDPSLPEGSRFISDDRDNYYEAGKKAYGDDYYKQYLPLPFVPKLHFGIGYPF